MGKKEITIIFILLLLIGVGYAVWQRSLSQKLPPSAVTNVSLQTYTNSKYGYQITYPSSLKIREFPDTGTGAGFRPADKPADPQYEVITVNVLPKVANEATTPLSEYAKIAAPLEIQNYQKLNSLEEIKTTSGEVGYKTTWLIAGQRDVSLPITYFALPAPNTYSTVQVSLSDKAYLSQYDQMITTLTTKNAP